MARLFLPHQPPQSHVQVQVEVRWAVEQGFERCTVVERIAFDDCAEVRYLLRLGDGHGPCADEQWCDVSDLEWRAA